MKGPSDRVLAAAGLAALVPCLAAPLSNPDLFWHLSAARRMAELRDIPRVDWLSSTLSGEAWTDFEWLQELLYGGIHHVWGMPGLWVLKILLMAAAAWVLWATMKAYGLPAPYRAASLAFWGSASLTRSDLRPDWASAIAFGLLFMALEARRLGRRAPGPWWAVPFFSAWANLHAGFPYGLLLLGLYRAWPYLAAGAAGTLLQPFGFSIYKVLASHWAVLGTMTGYIYEWGGIRLESPWHWPHWILLFASFGLALRLALKRVKIPASPLSALLFYSYAAFSHVRMAAYQAALALPLAGHWGQKAGLLRNPPPSVHRWLCLACIALCAAFNLRHAAAGGTFRRVFDGRYAPETAARFLEREKAALAPFILYNDQYGWGGYLGWRLYPDYRVFQDGRYIFHRFLREAAEVVGDPPRWRAFLDRYRVEVAVMENEPRFMATTRLGADGAPRDIPRPYYAVYLPKESWALVFWDEKALIFVKRSASVPEGWLERREYRLALPYDDLARNDAVARGELERGDVVADFRRHDAELAALRAAPLEAERAQR